MDLLNNSPKTKTLKVNQSIEADFPLNGKKIYRVSKVERFDFEDIDGKEQWEEFEKLINSINSFEFLQFTTDLTRCVIIYEHEIKYVDREEHDANLPTTDVPPT